MEVSVTDATEGHCGNCKGPYSKGKPYKIWKVLWGGHHGGQVIRLCHRCKQILIMELEK